MSYPGFPSNRLNAQAFPEPDKAVNGKEAVEMAKAKDYDLILMDVRMPEMDGYEDTRQIRKLPGYENTPVLALTADKGQEKHRL